MEQKNTTPETRKAGRPGAVLVYSLLVLSALLIVVTAFSLYVTRASRTLAVATDTAVATYVAESGVEEGLFLLRRKGVSVADVGIPYDRRDSGGNVVDTVDPLASIASTSAAATYDANDLRFFQGVSGFSGTAFAELRSTSTVKEIIMDVAEDDVAYADVYDASGATDLAVGSGIGSVLVEWDQGTGAAWLEASLVELDAQPSGAELRSPRTQVLGPTLHSGYCFSDLSAVGPANLHRLRFRALFDDIRNLRITGFRSTACPANVQPTVLPGRTTVAATGRYRNAKQTVQISMPQQTLPSGLFGFVVFSDQSLVKLSAGVGNLQFWPSIGSDPSFRWSDGQPAVPGTYRFMYPVGGGVPSAASTTVELPSGFFGAASEQVPVFVLVNTDRSGFAFASGEVTRTVSSNYAGKLQLDYSFTTAAIAGTQVVAEPLRPGTYDRLKTCEALAGPGPLLLTAYGTVPTSILDGDGNPVGSYYTDRCAVGVRLADPTGVTTANPLRGRLQAYADPGGTASVALEYDPPMPVLRVERQGADGSWVGPILSNTIYDFGGVAEDSQVTTAFRICNVGAEGTILTVAAGAIAVANTDPVGSTAFSEQAESGVPAALARVPGADCSSGATATFDVRFSPPDPVAYGGTLDVATNASNFHLSLRGNAAITSPDWDGNWDCWGIGDSPAATDPGVEDLLNEVRCEWTKFSGVDSYELQPGSSCSDERTVSGPDPIIPISSSSCGADTCTITYDVAGDTAASAADDIFRCHQVRSVAGVNRSLWSTVRGTTGAAEGSVGSKLFFVAYSHVSAPVSTRFSGDMASQDPSSPDTWNGGANQVCTQWAQTKLGISGNFKAWLCANGSPCQALTGSRTYVWKDSGSAHLPGASFRTDPSGVPVQDFWRGGATLSCEQNPNPPSDCRTERRHVLSESTFDRAMYFRTGRGPTGVAYDGTAQSCQNGSAQSWSSDSPSSGAHFGIAGRFGAQRWFTTTEQQGSDVPGLSCSDSERFGVYCFEEDALSGSPSGLNVTWLSPFRFTATWVDGVSGETSYRVRTVTAASTTMPLRPANSTTLTNQTVPNSACAQLSDFANTSWKFTVDATNGTTWTASSTQVSTRPVIEAPTNLEVEWTGATTAVLHWDDQSYEGGYVVYRDGTAIATTTTSTVSYSMSSLSGTHAYTVRAFVHSGAACSPGRYVYGAYSAATTYTPVASIKHIRISTTVRNGNLMGLPGATLQAKVDALCQGNFGAGWKALLWDMGTTPADPFASYPVSSAPMLSGVVHSGVTYANQLNRVLFTASGDNVVPDNLIGTIERPGDNARQPWTGYPGSSGTFIPVTTNCTDWTDSMAGGRFGYKGLPSYRTYLWHGSSAAGWTQSQCDNQRPLYCVEQ